MGDTQNEKLTSETHDADAQDAQATHSADRMPTGDEDRLAESQSLDPKVKESYEEANERGAKAKGEGRIA
jgi:hypothetical protein